MPSTHSERMVRSMPWLEGAFAEQNSFWSGREDNSLRLERLRRNLRRAKQEVLTLRQGQVMTMYYEQQKTIHQIAEELGVNPSTVCRTLQRGRARLKRCLEYSI